MERFSIALKNPPFGNHTIIDPTGSLKTFKLDLPLGFCLALPMREFQEVFIQTANSDYGKKCRVLFSYCN